MPPSEVHYHYHCNWITYTSVFWTSITNFPFQLLIFNIIIIRVGGCISTPGSFLQRSGCCTSLGLSAKCFECRSNVREEACHPGAGGRACTNPGLHTQITHSLLWSCQRPVWHSMVRQQRLHKPKSARVGVVLWCTACASGGGRGDVGVDPHCLLIPATSPLHPR